jgi:DNA-binding response OmpR family regulator
MIQRWNVLAVDDEPLNLEIIRECLDDPRLRIDVAPDAEKALAMIEAVDVPYDLVILDRMMPGMNGIEVLRRMKSAERFRQIPVIMQTAAAAPHEVREGIEAGAHYYLTKPYAPEALQGIVRAALSDIDERRAAARRVEEHSETLRLVDQATFRFRTIDEACRLAGLLAALTREPEATSMGLSELLINAVEHGNLGISYTEKSRLKRTDGWDDEIRRRQALPEHAGKSVQVRVARQDGQINFAIRDEGPGFQWRDYLEIDPARAGDPNGRGIAMARMLSFATLEYRGAGNEVVASVPAADPPPSV